MTPIDTPLPLMPGNALKASSILSTPAPLLIDSRVRCSSCSMRCRRFLGRRVRGAAMERAGEKKQRWVMDLAASKNLRMAFSQKTAVRQRRDVIT